jgi:hypothetical protein
MLLPCQKLLVSRLTLSVTALVSSSRGGKCDRHSLATNMSYIEGNSILAL